MPDRDFWFFELAQRVVAGRRRVAEGCRRLSARRVGAVLPLKEGNRLIFFGGGPLLVNCCNAWVISAVPFFIYISGSVHCCFKT